MADSPVRVNVREGESEGQAQVAASAPDTGKHLVYEVAAVTDYVITDARSDLAVQVPEGVGASTVGHRSPLGEALQSGTVEEQLAEAAKSNAPESEQKPAAVQSQEQADANAA